MWYLHFSAAHPQNPGARACHFLNGVASEISQYIATLNELETKQLATTKSVTNQLCDHFNPGVVVDFRETEISSPETAPMEVCVDIVSGSLEREVTVQLISEAGTASR